MLHEMAQPGKIQHESPTCQLGPLGPLACHGLLRAPKMAVPTGGSGGMHWGWGVGLDFQEGLRADTC